MPSVPIHNQGQDSVSQAMEVDTAPTPEQSERPGILEQPQAPENPSALAQTFSNLSLTAEELERLNGLSTPEWESIYAALITSSTGIEGRGGHVQATPAADVLEQPRAPENLSLEENRYNAPEIPPIPADKDALNTLGENTADQMQHVTITPRSSNNDENARQADDRDPLEEHHQVPHAPPSSSNEEELTLRKLPLLESIYSGLLICNSLEKVTILGCTNLKRIAISLPLPYLKRLKVSPRDWWEQVEWGHPIAKANLSSALTGEFN
ncbi:hypothetical protein Tsubulata_031172, partial [Turnera subulata]